MAWNALEIAEKYGENRKMPVPSRQCDFLILFALEEKGAKWEKTG
jgi:hypothetical protein